MNPLDQRLDAMASIQTQSGRLESDCQQAIADIRASLIELYASMEVDPELPQEASRRFGLNKNLTWKVSKIIQATDGFTAIQHLPGAAGWEIFLSTVSGAGAPAQLIETVRGSLRSFEEFVSLHAGDRQQLELMLDSMGVGSGGTGQLENSRELAFRGNSGIWGVQAKTRLTAGFVAPSPTDPTKVDTALCAGLIGFRRLRPNVSWPLFRFQSYSDAGAILARLRNEIEPKGAGDVPRLLRQFCSPALPLIEAVQENGAMDYILPAGPVGNLGTFNCFFGDIAREQNRYREPGSENAEFASTVTLPVESLVFDVFVHNEVQINEPPAVLVYGHPSGGPDIPGQRREEHRLPISERFVELAGRPPSVAIPLVPRYSELMQTVCRRMECDPSEFRGYRLTMRFPPMASTVVVRWPLAVGHKRKC